MGETAVLASLFKIEMISTGTTYVEIGGLDTITPEWNETEADLSTKSSKDADGNDVEEHLIARRGSSYSLEGKYLADLGATPVTRDAGQAAFEAAAKLTGRASQVAFKITYPDGSVDAFTGTCSMKSMGGDKDEASKWSGTIKVTGGVTTTPLAGGGI